MGWFKKSKPIRLVVEHLASMLEDFSAWEVNGDIEKFLDNDGVVNIRHKERGFNIIYCWVLVLDFMNGCYWKTKIRLPDKADFTLTEDEVNKLDIVLRKMVSSCQSNLEVKKYNHCLEMITDIDLG